MGSRSDRARRTSRRRRRRVARGLVKTIFWSFVLAGVFVLGLGFGRTLSSEDATAKGKVTITADRGPVQVTLPTKTETVTKTVTAPAKKVAAKPATR